jgi:hypothetical protein
MLNQGENCLSPLPFNFAIELVFRKVQEDEEKLHLEEAR